MRKRRTFATSTMAHVIYFLMDPPTDTPRYVGFSYQVEVRFRTHLADCKDSYKVRWMDSLWEQYRALPTLKKIAIVQGRGEAKRVEIALIAALRARGIPLTNGTKGGDGCELTPELLEKRSHSIKIAHVNMPEEKRKIRNQKISKALMGKPLSQSHRETLRQSQQRRWLDPKAHEQARRSHLGHVTPEEVKQKQSASHKGRVKSPEHIAAVTRALHAFHEKRVAAGIAMIPWNKGKKGVSEETRKRQSDSHLHYWAKVKTLTRQIIETKASILRND